MRASSLSLFMPFSLLATLLCCCWSLFTLASPLAKCFLILIATRSFLFFLSLSLSRFPPSTRQPYTLVLDWRSFLIHLAIIESAYPIDTLTYLSFTPQHPFQSTQHLACLTIPPSSSSCTLLTSPSFLPTFLHAQSFGTTQPHAHPSLPF